MNKHTAEKILTLATSLRTDAAEVYLRSYSSTVIEVKEHKVDAFERANDIGAGLRVIVGERMGFAFTTDLSDIALRNLVHASVTNAQNTEPDPFHSLPDKSDSDYPEVAIYDPDVVKLTEKEKIDRIMAMERTLWPLILGSTAKASRSMAMIRSIFSFSVSLMTSGS